MVGLKRSESSQRESEFGVEIIYNKCAAGPVQGC